MLVEILREDLVLMNVLGMVAALRGVLVLVEVRVLV